MRDRPRWVVLLTAVAVLCWIPLSTWRSERDAERFRARVQELLDRPRKGPVITIGEGDDATHFTDRELNAAAATVLHGPRSPYVDHVRPLYRDPVPAIVDFRDRLRERGIELVLVPTPIRPWVHPAWLWEDGTSVDPVAAAAPWNDLLDALRAEDLNVVDVLPAFQAGAWWDPERWVNHGDQHSTNVGMQEIARQVADRLDALGLVTGPPVETTVRTRHVRKKMAIAQQFGRALGEERFDVREVHDSAGAPLARSNPDAPIVVIGDSNLVWYENYDANLLVQLSHELGVAVDSVVARGSGATEAREQLVYNDRLDPGYLDRKRVVVWVFHGLGPRDEEWRIVPLEPRPPTRVEIRSAPPQLETDLVLFDGPDSLAHRSDRFRDVKEPGKAAWMKNRTANLSFPVPDGARYAELVLDLTSRVQGDLALQRPGQEPFAILALEKGRKRHRIPLDALDPPLSGGEVLELQWRRGVQGLRLGVHLAVLVAKPVVAELEPPPRRPRRRVESWSLPENRPEALSARIRWRARQKGCRPKVRVTVGGEQLADVEVPTWWSEISVALPESNAEQLRFRRRCSDGEGPVAAVDIASIELERR